MSFANCKQRVVPVALLAAAVGAGGCATGTHRGASSAAGARAAAIDWARTRPFGAGARFAPPARGPRVSAAAPVAGMRCGARADQPYGVHVELFAAGRGVRIPAGIGLAPPLRHSGPVVMGERCSYPLRTVDPTGVVEVDARTGRSAPTVGALFALWAQPLTLRRLAGFRAHRGQRVVAFVDGRRWAGDPRAIPLRPHAAVVLELGPTVSPHPSYVFAPGL